MGRMKKLILGALVTAAILATPEVPFLFGPSQAEAVIGRPLTPVSYAGVARRTVRRSYYYR